MSRSICLFEDKNWHNLNPLVYFVPTYELRCGIFTFKERIEKLFPSDKVLIHARQYLTESIIGQMYDNILFDPNFSEDWIFINGRTLADDHFVKFFDAPGEDFIVVNNGTVLGAYVTGENKKKLFNSNPEFPDFSTLTGITIKNSSTKFIQYPWDLIKYNGETIQTDYHLRKTEKENNLKNFESVIFKNRDLIQLGKYCEIEPFVYLNADKGPIVIGDHVKIYAHSSIEGPVYIGHSSVIKTHSSIYHDTSIGPVCKVGGEIENSIIHSYSNKQHHGFLGHSYLGQWINIGAGTTNSDLKNNYSTIRATLEGKEIDTGMTFLGSLIGDHTKTAIGTRLNTGSVIGPCCNIYSDQSAPKCLPAFTWLNNSYHSEYALDKIVETTKLVYSRRGIIFTDSDHKLFREVFDYTKPERNV